MAIHWQSLLGINQFRESARYWLDEGSYAVNDRIELAKLEWQTQRNALVRLAIAAALLLYVLFGFLFLGSTAVLLHWQGTPQWGAAVWAVLLFWGGLALVSIVLLLLSRKRLARPFVLTRQVLAADFHDLKERL